MPNLRSIFEVYRIGAGPSSSHSMGPQRAAEVFKAQFPEPPAHVDVYLFGSLAETGKGHLTDQAIAKALAPLPHTLHWETGDLPGGHPNTMRFVAQDADGRELRRWTVASIGGGAIEDERGQVENLPPADYPFTTMKEILTYCREQSCTIWQVAESFEQDLWPRLGEVWAVMQDSLRRGLDHHEAVLPGELHLPRRAATTYRRAECLASPQKDLALLSAYALAVAEENASGGIIATAPSCGPAGVVPGLLYYYQQHRGRNDRQLLEALATAGLFGSVIRANASVSGAEVGCQGEIGSACSMAAAAGCQLEGGSHDQIEYAAEIGMEHHLGLTCDPVLGYVQIPCIERNMTACLRAFECASFALLTDGKHLVSFDEVIEVMDRTGRDLQSAYRETARGGLADLWRRRMTHRP